MHTQTEQELKSALGAHTEAVTGLSERERRALAAERRMVQQLPTDSAVQRYTSCETNPDPNLIPRLRRRREPLFLLLCSLPPHWFSKVWLLSSPEPVCAAGVEEVWQVWCLMRDCSTSTVP